MGGSADLFGVGETRKIICLISASHKQRLATPAPAVITSGPLLSPRAGAASPGTGASELWSPGRRLICPPLEGHVTEWVIDLFFFLGFDFTTTKINTVKAGPELGPVVSNWFE